MAGSFPGISGRMLSQQGPHSHGQLTHLHSIGCYTQRPTASAVHTLPQHRLRSVPEDRDSQEVDDGLLRDIERYQQREQQQQQGLRTGLRPSSLEAEEGGTAAVGNIKDLLDKVLIADFFFVCAALAWLVAGVGAKAALDSSALLDAWFPLWQWVFQPAIGVLMLGAIISGIVGRSTQQ